MSGYIWVLWDLAALTVLVVFISSGAGRGFIRTAVGLLGYVAAIAAARLGSPPIAQFLYDNVVRDALRIVLENNLKELTSGAETGEIVRAIPGGLVRIMNGDVSGLVTEKAAAGVGGLIESLVDDALREPVLTLLRGLVFLLLFTLTLLFARKLSWLFNGVNGIPFVGTLNVLLGGIVGVAQAVLALVILSLALQLVILFTGGYFWLDARVIDDTYILRVFYGLAKL